MKPDFRYYLRVRYGECDAQKVVFNARYGDYIDLASSEFMRALGYGLAMDRGELDYQLVKQTMEWKAPARYGDALEISVRCERTGTTSFSLGFEFRIAGSAAVISRCETIYVVVDAVTLGKRALPEAVRESLHRGAPGVVCDHAAFLSAAPSAARQS